MSRTDNGNERHVLTDHDRQFLRGEKDIKEGSKQNARGRIRTRFMCALEDLQELSNNPLAWNVDKFIEGMSAEQDDEVYQNLVSAVGLLYLLANRSTVDPERLFSEGVLDGSGRFARDAKVDIEVDYPRETDIGYIKSKLMDGEMPDPWEIGILYYYGHHKDELQFGEGRYEVQELIQRFAERRDLRQQADYLYTH